MGVERFFLEQLRRQIDVDLVCYGENVTCDTMDALTVQGDLFNHCNQDPEMLHSTCEFVCRANRHPTLRCIYEWDKNNKFGMRHDPEDDWEHCVLTSGCEDNATEVFGVYCNQTGDVENGVLPEDSNISMVLGLSIGVGATGIFAIATFLFFRRGQAKS